MEKQINVGDKVYVSGEVNYGGIWYKVATNGIVESIQNKSMIVTLDNIDGDNNSCVTVSKKNIYKID